MQTNSVTQLSLQQLKQASRSGKRLKSLRRNWISSSADKPYLRTLRLRNEKEEAQDERRGKGEDLAGAKAGGRRSGRSRGKKVTHQYKFAGGNSVMARDRISGLLGALTILSSFLHKGGCRFADVLPGACAPEEMRKLRVAVIISRRKLINARKSENIAAIKSLQIVWIS